MKLKEGLNEYSINISNQEIHFRCNYIPESSEVLIFFHGLACSWDTFKNVLDKNYFPDKSLLFLDHIGFGNSAKTESFSYTMHDQAKVIDELISVLPQWNIHIVAHSMGVAIALLLGRYTLSRVISFANIEGNLISEDCGIMSRKIVDMPFEDYKDKLYKYHLFAFKSHDQLHFDHTSPYAIYQSAVSLVKESDSGELLIKYLELDCNKCYFFGEENKEMPILKELANSNRIMIKNSGHSMTSQNPEEFYSKLVEFINTVKAQSA